MRLLTIAKLIARRGCLDCHIISRAEPWNQTTGKTVHGYIHMMGEYLHGTGFFAQPDLEGLVGRIHSVDNLTEAVNRHDVVGQGIFTVKGLQEILFRFDAGSHKSGAYPPAYSGCTLSNQKQVGTPNFATIDR